MGGTVPKTYYSSEKKLLPLDGMLRTYIPAGAKKKLKFEMINSNVVLR